MSPIDQGRYVAEHIPGARFVELSGANGQQVDTGDGPGSRSAVALAHGDSIGGRFTEGDVRVKVWRTQ